MKKITVALMIGRKGSKGFPGKNTTKVVGRALAEYPLIAAKKSKSIDRIYVSTDCIKIKKISTDYNAINLKRPNRLSTSKALGEDVFVDGYNKIKDIIKSEGKEIEFVVLLHANGPLITTKMIDKGIKDLRKNKTLDSAVSTSVYNMWSPIRARKLTKEGLLKPFVPFQIFGNPKTLNCDRDSQGDVYYADMGLSIVRPRCLENIHNGLLPQKWMGKKIIPIKSEAGFDVDYVWQIPSVEYWLKKNGVKPKKSKN